MALDGRVDADHRVAVGQPPVRQVRSDETSTADDDATTQPGEPPHHPARHTTAAASVSWHDQQERISLTAHARHRQGAASPLARLAARLKEGWSTHCVTCVSLTPRPAGGRKAGDVVLVGAGAGFIGSHVIDGLLPGGDYRVRVLDGFVTGLRDNLAYCLDQIDRADGDLCQLKTVDSAFAESR